MHFVRTISIYLSRDQDDLHNTRCLLLCRSTAEIYQKEGTAMFFQKDIETMPREELEALQLQKLKAQVQYCIDNVPFYRDRLAKAGVTADKIKCLSDIQYIPYTTKEDIRDNYPYGLFAVPMKNIVRIHACNIIALTVIQCYI